MIELRLYNSDKDFLYQWDLNQRVTSDNLQVGDEVHFHSKAVSRALPVKAYEHDGNIVADIPNILLQRPFTISAYRYITDDVLCCTVDEFSFEVKPRACPADYIYEETEIYNLDKAVEDALLKAKENGDFKGDQGEKGDPGDDYIITEEDKNELKAYIDQQMLPLIEEINGVEEELKAINEGGVK